MPPQARSGTDFTKMVQLACDVLNATYPEKSGEFWLCYNVTPPNYEGVALSGFYRKGNSESRR